MSAGEGASSAGAAGELDDLQTRVARALLVVDLDQLLPAARDEARRLIANNEREFDGAALVETCLRHAPPASTSSVQRAMIALRSRFLGHDMVSSGGAAPPKRKKRSGFKRFVAWLLVKLMFWPILIALTVVILVLLKRSNPEIDVYVWGAKAMDFLGLR